MSIKSPTGRYHHDNIWTREPSIRHINKPGRIKTVANTWYRNRRAGVHANVIVKTIQPRHKTLSSLKGLALNIITPLAFSSDFAAVLVERTPPVRTRWTPTRTCWKSFADLFISWASTVQSVFTMYVRGADEYANTTPNNNYIIFIMCTFLTIYILHTTPWSCQFKDKGPIGFVTVNRAWLVNGLSSNTSGENLQIYYDLLPVVGDGGFRRWIMAGIWGLERSEWARYAKRVATYSSDIYAQWENKFPRWLGHLQILEQFSSSKRALTALPR